MRFIEKIVRAVGFVFFFLWELVLANAYVAYEVATPRLDITPGIIRVPIRSDSDLEVTMLANLITLTPGTLTIEVARDHSALFVHGFNVSSPENLRASVGKLEDKLLRVLR